jgi:outer membrane protein OmpA-like peptidoglycan-associated protein
MSSLGRFALALLPCAFLVSSFFACGGPSQRSCASEAPWSGTCKLKSVVKIRHTELPVPHGIFEVIYEPQSNPSNPNFTPPALREEIRVLASQELELDDYFKKNETAPCQMAASPQGTCQPGAVSIALPQFQPTGATPSQEIRGCAQIESQASQDRLPELSKNAQQMPEIMLFGESSAATTPEIVQAAQAVAQRIKSSPGIECVAVVGQVSPGEQGAVATERAKAIRQILLQNGVEPARLTTITVTAAVYGGGTEAPPPDPAKRRVTLRVLLAR